MQKSFIFGLLFLIILAGTVSAKAVIPVYDCQTLDKTGGYYQLMNDISTDDTCFIIGADKITFDLQGHTVKGVSYLQAVSGILLNEFDSLVIKNGEIREFNDGISLSNSEGHRIINMVLDKNKYLGISFNEIANAIIENNQIKNTQGYGEGMQIQASHNITIVNNTLDSNGAGIALYFGGNNLIKKNSITGSNVESGILLDSSYNNDIIYNNLDFNDEGITLYDSSYNFIGNNWINNSEGQGSLFIVRSPNNVIKDIKIENSGRYDLKIEITNESQCDNQIINVTGSNGKPALYASSTVTWNNLEASQVILCNADNSVLNNITVNSLYPKTNGIQVLEGYSILLNKVTVNNTFDGIWIVKSKHVYVKRSNISNGRYGVYIGGNSHSIGISENTINKNSQEGIWLEDTSNDQIEDNWIEFNGDSGILFEEDVYSIKVHNNFFRNFDNINFGEGEFVSWNSSLFPGPNIIGGPFIGGNFWANPSGTGFSETCVDSDENGICDQQYMVAENNFDYYPLTH